MLAPDSAAALGLGPAQRHERARPGQSRPVRPSVADLTLRRVHAVIVACAIALVAITATSFALSLPEEFEGMATHVSSASVIDASGDSPVEIAQRRYAEGEITLEQFQEIMHTLSLYRAAPGPEPIR